MSPDRSRWDYTGYESTPDRSSWDYTDFESTATRSRASTSTRSEPTEINSRWDELDSHEGGLPPDWEARRSATLERDDYTCTNCGIRSGPYAGNNGASLHADHAIPRSNGGSHRLVNLRTLCASCHNDSHGHDIFRDGWVGDRPSRSRWRRSRGRGVLGRLNGTWVGASLALLAALPVAVGASILTRVLFTQPLIALGAWTILAGIIFVIPIESVVAYALASVAGGVFLWTRSYDLLSPMAAVIAGLVWVPTVVIATGLYTNSLRA